MCLSYIVILSSNSCAFKFTASEFQSRFRKQTETEVVTS